jgi:soluble lytic murein transglycosylase
MGEDIMAQEKSMSKSACLILGSVLFLQAPIALSDASLDLSSNEAAAVPLFHEEHSRELIDGGVQTGVAPEEMARFIFKRTRELLPVPFKGRSVKIAEALIESANRYQMDPVFLMAVIAQESKFNPNALGSHGEIGLMQLKPTTALSVASGTSIDSLPDVASALKDPVQNIRFGAAYLARLRASFKHRSSLYISAYNMGAARVRMRLAEGIQPRIYSNAVLAHYVELSGGIAQTVASRTELQVFNRTLAL